MNFFERISKLVNSSFCPCAFCCFILIYTQFQYKITIMNSPTSNLLVSIQALKNKLRSDHHELQGIRKDFALPISVIPEELDNKEFKVSKTCGKDCRQKLIDLRKKQQGEISSLMKAHEQQKCEIIEKYDERLKEVEEELGKRVKEQQEYITTLEEQIANSSISLNTNDMKNMSLQKDSSISCRQSNTGKNNLNEVSELSSRYIEANEEKYEHIVNSLLQQNAILMETVERLKMENRRLSVFQQESSRVKEELKAEKSHTVESKNYCSLQEKPMKNSGNSNDSRHNPIFANKNRLKFSKIGERKSMQVINDQNRDVSNFASVSSSWQEDSIMSEDMKMRTIKHLLSNAERNSVQTRKYNA